MGRFRHARGIERAQLRWLAWGATLAATMLVVALVELVRHGEPGIRHARWRPGAG